MGTQRTPQTGAGGGVPQQASPDPLRSQFHELLAIVGAPRRGGELGIQSPVPLKLTTVDLQPRTVFAGVNQSG